MRFFLGSLEDVIEWISRITGLTPWIQKQQNEWINFLFVMSGVIMHVMFILFYFSFLKYFYLIIGSPIYAYLSEKTESIVEGQEHHFSFNELTLDIGRGIRVAVRNMLWQTLYLVLLILLSLVPVIGWIAPLIAIFAECFYYGSSMLDYSLERHKLSFAQSIAYIARHKGLAIGNGMVVFGWIAPAYAVIAATLSLHKVKTS
jgi:CysZ protein